MTSQPKTESIRETDPTHPVTAHILFMDLVGFTRLPMDKQRVYVRELQTIVFSAPAYAEAEAAGQVIVRPTGDGMAIAFFQSLQQPAQVAREVSEETRGRQDLKVRMGLHSGHVFVVKDANGNPDIIGEGINTAQRVMDCGDVGHILLSATAAQILQNSEEWKRNIHGIGEAEVKHGQVVQLFNAYSRRFGNGRIPKKISGQKIAKLELGRNIQRIVRWGAAIGVVAALAFFGPKVFPTIRDSSSALYRRVFKPTPKALLVEIGVDMGIRNYGAAFDKSREIIANPDAAQDEKAEATYRLVSAALAKGDTATAQDTIKAFPDTFKTLSKDHWVRRALQIEPALNTARDLFRDAKYGPMSEIAVRISGNTEARPEQRAEANHLLIEAAVKSGSKPKGRVYFARLERLKKSLPESHFAVKAMAKQWEAIQPPPPPPGPEEVLKALRALGTGDEAKMAALALKVRSMGDASATQRAEALYHLLSASNKRGEMTAVQRHLTELGSQKGSLQPEYQTDVDNIRKDMFLRRAADSDGSEQWDKAASAARSALSAIRVLEDDGGQMDNEKAQAWYYLIHALEKLNRSSAALSEIEKSHRSLAHLKSVEPQNPWLNSIGEVQARINVNGAAPTGTEPGADPATSGGTDPGMPNP